MIDSSPKIGKADDEEEEDELAEVPIILNTMPREIKTRIIVRIKKKRLRSLRFLTRQLRCDPDLNFKFDKWNAIYTIT